MATTIYNKQIEWFYRSVGEGDLTVVNGASSSTLNKGAVVGYTPKRWSLEEVYDLFWAAGMFVYRALKAFDFEKVVKLVPSLLTTEEVTLTANAGTISKSFDFVYDRASVYKSPNTYVAKKISEMEAVETILLSSGFRKSPTETNPKFIIENNRSIKVYPLTGAHTKITIRGVLAVERLVACTNNSDTWNSNYSDLLKNVAVMIAKGDAGDTQIQQYLMGQIQMELQLLQPKPLINQTEEQK